jgi:hypothetical protein
VEIFVGDRGLRTAYESLLSDTSKHEVLRLLLLLRIILLDLILRYHYQSLLTFPNLSNQNNICRIEESEIYHNNKGDITD